MERILIYTMAVLNILLGFWILYRGGGRFGLQTYRGYLNREEGLKKKNRKSSRKKTNEEST